jgi:hypothetical protein
MIYVFHDILWCQYMKSEMIQIVSCDNYDAFPHLSFIFSWKLISLL